VDIRVNPTSVQAYGRSAQEIFGQIRSDLEGMVNDVVNVPYQGPNAVKFKSDCGALAADFATALTSDLRAIADAVQASTTNIAVSLGGQPVRIEFNGGTVTVPAVPQGDGAVSANTAGLEALKGTVKARFASVGEHFSTHLSQLTSTDWTGQAKEQAVQAVSAFTANARAKVDEASTKLINFVDAQVRDLATADK
jgi:hypothetical protein